jgi:hypothetical protein
MHGGWWRRHMGCGSNRPRWLRLDHPGQRRRGLVNDGRRRRLVNDLWRWRRVVNSGRRWRRLVNERWRWRRVVNSGRRWHRLVNDRRRGGMKRLGSRCRRELFVGAGPHRCRTYGSRRGTRTAGCRTRHSRLATWLRGKPGQCMRRRRWELFVGRAGPRPCRACGSRRGPRTTWCRTRHSRLACKPGQRMRRSSRLGSRWGIGWRCGIGRLTRLGRHYRCAGPSGDNPRTLELGGTCRGRDRGMTLTLRQRKRGVLSRRLHVVRLLLRRRQVASA